MAAHGGSDGRVLVDLGLFMVAGASIELASSAGRLVLLAGDGGSGLLGATELRSQCGDTAVFGITLGITVLTDTDAVDTALVLHGDELGADTVSHVVLGDGTRGDVSVASSHGFGTTGQEGSSRHRHGLELVLLTGAIVGKDESEAAVFVLLIETDVDGLLCLTECLGTVEDSLLEGLLGHSCLGALCVVHTEGYGRPLEELHHSLCTVFIILHEDLVRAGRLAAIREGVVPGVGRLGGVVKACSSIAGTLVGSKLLRTRVIDVDLTLGLELSLVGIDSHGDGGGAGGCGGSYIVLGKGRCSNLRSGEHAIDGECWGVHVDDRVRM